MRSPGFAPAGTAMVTSNSPGRLLDAAAAPFAGSPPTKAERSALGTAAGSAGPASPAAIFTSVAPRPLAVVAIAEASAVPHGAPKPASFAVRIEGARAATNTL